MITRKGRFKINAEITWISSNNKPSTEQLIADYERLVKEAELVKKELIKAFYRSHNLPAWAIHKQPSIQWTEKEFSEMLAELEKTIE